MQEKQFSTPVQMKISSKDQYNYLAAELIKLGYTEATVGYTEFVENSSYIITNYSGSQNLFTNFAGLSLSRVLISEYNPDLFLALVAMTSNDDFFDGEYILWKQGEDEIYKTYKEGDVYGVYWKDRKYPYKNYKNLWRKATKEEIINYFNKKQLKEENMEKRLIGYRLKEKYKEYEKIIVQICNLGRNIYIDNLQINQDGVSFTIGSLCAYHLDTLGLLHWFEEVYKETRKDVHVQVTPDLSFCISQNYEGQVIESKEGKSIPIQVLKQIQKGFSIPDYPFYYLISITFNIGCVQNIQLSKINDVIQEYNKFWNIEEEESTF